MVFTDHDTIGGIMKSTNFNIISINCINRRFTNTSIYLFIYPLDVYYIFGYYNLVFNTFLYFRVLKDDTIRVDNEVEPIFDTI